MRALVCCLLLVTSAALQAAEIDGHAIAEMMRQARQTPGFEARFNLLVKKGNGANLHPMKVSMIGSVTTEKQRVLIRGIAPDQIRDQVFVAESQNGGPLKALQYRTKKINEAVRYDPTAKLFDSGLVIWDMMGGWWFWPKQIVAGHTQINGRDCIRVRSVNEDKKSTIQEVESCIDPDAKVSIKTKFIDQQNSVIRTITVDKLIRKRETAMAAKKLTIQSLGDEQTEIEVYAGDEQYEITPETFAALEQ